MCAALPQPLPQQVHASAQHHDYDNLAGQGNSNAPRACQATRMMVHCGGAQGEIGKTAGTVCQAGLNTADSSADGDGQFS